MNTWKIDTSPMARVPLLKAIALALTLAVLLGSGRGALARTAPAPGVASDGEYDAVQFTWVVLWEQPWTVDEEMTTSESGAYDRLVLQESDATIQVSLDFDQSSVVAFDTMLQVMSIKEDDLAIVGTDAGIDDGDWPYLAATLTYTGTGPDGTEQPLIEYIEVGPALTNDLEYGVHLTSLVAPESDFADAFASAQAHVTSNLGEQGTFFVGEPAEAGTQNDTGATGSPDDELSGDEYVDWLKGELATLSKSIIAFQYLVQDPNFGDEQTMESLDTILATWTNADDRAQAIVPPSGFEEFHAEYLDATSLLAGAAQDIAQGNGTNAGEELDGALTTLQDLTSKLYNEGYLLTITSG